MNINLERQLRKDMSFRNPDIDFDPVEHEIIVDGKTYEYPVNVNGKRQGASYDAIMNPHGDPRVLMCCYGLVNESKRYTYYSHQKRS